MQKIYYEKEIDLSHRLKEMTSMTVDESIDYKIEDQGVRAVGSLIIKGEYISDENRIFVENIDLDVFAEEKKITDQRDFHLKVEDFHYEIIDGNLKVTIEVGVYGVIADRLPQGFFYARYTCFTGYIVKQELDYFRQFFRAS